MGGGKVVTGKEFADRLESLGYDFFTGVPCSLIEGVLRVLEAHPRFPYLPAVREDVAVGLAAGAWLGGRRPAVLMQNSGLGTGLNALASLALLYRLPSLLVVTWRGHQGADAPEHLLTGAITPGLLDLLGIRHRALTPASVEADLDWATEEAERRMEPVALVVPPGVLDREETAPPPPPRSAGAGGTASGAPRRAQSDEHGGADRRDRTSSGELTPTLSRYEALRAAVECLSDEPVIHANGYICRESHAVADRSQNFYMIGSMGLASAIGLGLALARPARRVVVFDGDGNLLMNLGVVANVAALAPRNLVHVVFDNEAYGSTGNQPTVSAVSRLDGIAAAAGYRTVAAVDEADGVAGALRAMLATDGPHFLLVKVTQEEAPVPRVPHAPEALRDRFRAAVLAR